MEFKQAVGNRRSIRYYQPYRPVEKDKLQTILEAARLQCQHGNAGLVRKAVVVTRGETDDAIREELIDALYNQPQATQAPVAIVWAIDISGWENLRENLLNLIDAKALTSSYGWSEQFVEETVLKTPDFNVLAGDNTFAEWLSAIEMGLAIGSALLAAVDLGLGTQLLTGRRDQIRELFGMPEHVTPAQIQIVGYPAENPDGGGQRPRPPFEDLYFADTWGNSMQRDPAVVEDLRKAGMIQESAPLPWRADEVRALAAMFGLPE
ncbi:MAG: nitroreductase family protein [Actinobacteria bacterium]|nr:nitroreductase family protein [Actinomycetota bacterium]